MTTKDIPLLRARWRDSVSDLAREPPNELPPWRNVNHEIKLIDPDATIPYRRAKCPDALIQQMSDKIDLYTKSNKWVFKDEKNASVMLCIPKKDSALRTVIDARTRNLNTIPDVTPMPDQESIRDRVASARYRSKIDLTNAFEQMRVVESDVKNTAFITIKGVMVSNVAQQGDRNAPASFQKLMVDLFRDYIGLWVDVYLDDIFVYTDTIERHEQCLKITFDILRTAKLYLSLPKLDLYSQQLDCLGHIINNDGIHADRDKMRRIREWPIPQDYKDVQRFLGLVNYISHFMPDVSAYMSPLSALSKKSKWQWLPIHTSCFNSIKALACKTPILKPIDRSILNEPRGRIWLVCDASVNGIGCYYGQGDNWQTCRPAGFLSKKFAGAQSAYFTQEQETIAILEGLNKWEDKLIGTRFTLVTDHESLEYLRTQPKLNRRQMRWHDYLCRFDYDILYVEGKINVVADAFSRYFASIPASTKLSYDDFVNVDRKLDAEGEELPSQSGKLPVPTFAFAAQKTTKTVQDATEQRAVESRQMSSGAKNIPNSSSPVVNVQTVWEAGSPTDSLIVNLSDSQFLTEILSGYKDDVVFQKILTESSHHKMLFRINVDGLIYTKNIAGSSVLCIPRTLFKGRRITEKICDSAHKLVGHHQSKTTIQYIKKWYWWPGMSKDIDAFCKSCGICQTTKPSTELPKGLLHSLPIPTRPWQSIGMDFVGPFPETEGYDYLLVIVCRFSSHSRLLKTRTTATSKDIAKLFLQEIVREFGTPESIVSDRDSKFISEFWRELNRLTSTKLLMSTAYHPQTDGKSEATVKKVTAILRTMVSPDQKDWVDSLPWAEFALNSSTSASTGYAPFEISYSWLPRISFTPGTIGKYEGVNQLIDDSLVRLNAAHDAIIESRVFQTHHANKHRSPDPTIKVGDKVYISTKDMNLPKGRARKLMPKFIGPYSISKVIPESSNYVVELPPQLVTRRLHNKFHVSKLRPHTHNDDERFPGREIASYYDFGEDPDVEWNVSKITSHRWERNKLIFRVQWEAGDSSWEPLSEVNKLSHLDDYLELYGVSEPKELPKEGAK